MEKDKGFMAMDILFSLFILSLLSLLLVYVFNNNIFYLARNEKISDLRLESQNLIDSINFDKNNLYRRELIEISSSDQLIVTKEKFKFTITKEPLENDLCCLYIRSEDLTELGLTLKWVIVIEEVY